MFKSGSWLLIEVQPYSSDEPVAAEIDVVESAPIPGIDGNSKFYVVKLWDLASGQVTLHRGKILMQT